MNAPLNIKEKLNQCLINRYLPGQGIGAHIDKVEFGDTIVCFTFGSGREMVFSLGDTAYNIRTEPLSMYVMTGDSRWKWKHEMKQRKSDNGIPRGTVYSITFREIIL